MNSLKNVICLLVVLGFCNVQVLGSPNFEASEHTMEGVSNKTIYRITVNASSSHHTCQSQFLSLALASAEISGPWFSHHFGSEKLHNLAAALSPADLRLGGTDADFLTFDPHGEVDHTDWLRQKYLDRNFGLDSGSFHLSEEIQNFTVTGKQWDRFISFVTKAGWDLMFDFNLFKWRDGLWDPANADLLLTYSSAKGYQIPYFQLGNEPNSFKHNFNFTISADTLVKDFQILKKVVSKYSLYTASKLYGPDVTNLDIHTGSRNYFKEFISAGGYDVVDELSLHFYYLDGKTATVEQFLEPSVLDLLKKEIELALEIAGKSPRPIPIRLTETSSCYGGGAPGLSDAYVAGFLWLDKLGLAAKYGLTRVFRQTFLGGNYALISDNLNPNPDFYSSVLYKRLIEGPVFAVSLDPPTQYLRVYAHCARKGLYAAGALVLYFLNLQAEEVVLSLAQFKGVDLDLYLLTPGDDKGLKSRYVSLNSKPLLMSGSNLPPLLPKHHTGDIPVNAYSYGFVVIPHSNIPLCVKYFATVAAN